VSKFDRLRKASTLNELAALLGFTPKGLSYVLYKLPKASLYSTFVIKKKSGGTRKIQAPRPELKLAQKRLAELLTFCAKDIEDKHPVRKVVSHGFQVGRSIVTNASHHRRKRYVLNVDIDDFFGTINFGRVRGFFINDKSFSLDPTVATVVAQIACFDNALPQGSPCSPIISNLLGFILDRRLIAIAKEYKCTYTRYADDLTFSTRARTFPKAIAYPVKASPGKWRIGASLKKAIHDAGFKINPKKTRMQIVGSRQTTTGLVVNEKINVAQEYYRDTRAMCHALFKSGKYHLPGGTPTVISDLRPLEGRLSYIHYVKARRDRTDSQNRAVGFIAPAAPEELYRRFLLFKYCVANPLPTLIVEGRSDIIYLSCAMKAQRATFPQLAKITKGLARINVDFIRHSKTADRLLNLGGGSGGMASFINYYRHRMKPYPYSPASAPIIILSDNDSGADCIFKAIQSAYKIKISISTSDPFFHLGGSLYFVKTPAFAGSSPTSCIEDLFPATVLGEKIDGKSFDKDKTHGDHTSFGKVQFAEKIIRPKWTTIDFTGFNPVLSAIVDVIADHNAKTALAAAPPTPPGIAVSAFATPKASAP
jgi:RNA-directed DNA polymerase